MTPEGAERLARLLHRYELDESGEPFTEHLARSAALVRAAGGGSREVTAVWLHGVLRAGLRPADLVTRGVSSDVIRIVEAVSRDPDDLFEPTARQVSAVRAVPGAALVLQAIISDRHRPDARIEPYGVYLAHRDRDLLAACGLPVPDRLAGPSRPEKMPASSPPPDTARLLRHVDGDDPDRGETVRVFTEMAAHRDESIRGEGIRGLAGVRGCLPLVEDALLDSSSWVAGMAARVLPDDRVAAMADRLVALVQRPGPSWEGQQALKKLAEAEDPRARELLLADLRPIDKSRDIPVLMRKLIEDDHPSVVPALISHLGTDRHSTVIACRILRAKRSREAAPAIAEALRAALDQDPEAALACIRALGKIQDPATIPALGQACSCPYPFIQDTALQALFWSGDPRVTEIALKAADDPSPKVRDRAVRLLAARGDQRATVRLITACDGPLRIAALRGLIRLADERAVPTLLSVLRTSTDRKTLRLAGRAIVVSVRTPLSISLWSGWTPAPPQLREAVWIAGQTSGPLPPDEFLRHWDEVVRARTVIGMGNSGNPVLPEIKAALTDISPRVRASAATALAAIVTSPPRKVSEYEARSIRLYETRVYLAAEQAREWLGELSDDPHPSVRAATAAALRRLETASPAPGNGPGET